MITTPDVRSPRHLTAWLRYVQSCGWSVKGIMRLTKNAKNHDLPYSRQTLYNLANGVYTPSHKTACEIQRAVDLTTRRVNAQEKKLSTKR